MQQRRELKGGWKRRSVRRGGGVRGLKGRWKSRSRRRRRVEATQAACHTHDVRLAFRFYSSMFVVDFGAVRVGRLPLTP